MVVISSQVKSKEKRCLIVAPNTSNVIVAVYKGLLQGLSSSLDKRGRHIEDCFVLSSEIAVGTGDNKKFYERINKKVISRKFDVIFTLGKNCSMMVQEITIKNRIFTPIVFSGVVNPHNVGLAVPGYKPHHHITGISAHARDYSEQVDALYSMVKGIVKIVVLVKSRLGMQYSEEDIRKARQLLEVKGFCVREVIIDGTHESLHNFTASLTDADLVFIPRETEVINYIADIIYICNQQKVPIYASDKESVNLGAVLGFGVEEHIIGVETAEKALPILLDGKAPSTIPVSPLRNDKLQIILNIVALHTQGGAIQNHLRKLISYKNVQMIRP